MTCRDEAYLLAGGGGQWVLTKPDGVRYTVRHGPAGWWCDCNDWKFRGRRRPCKHIRAVKAQTGETA